MNKLYIFILSLIVVSFVSCSSDDDCDLIHESDIYGTPNVIKGSFPEEKLTPALGEEITFSPKLKDNTGVTYSWVINGAEVSTDSSYTYKVENPCRINLTCKIKNELGTAVLTAEIASKQDFSKGFLFVAGREIGFYDASAEKTYHNCFSSLNYGSRIAGEGDILVTPVNNDFYIMIKNSISNSNHFVIAEAETLSRLNDIRGSTNYVYFMALNERYALISTFNKVSRLDMKSNQIVEFTNKVSPVFDGIIFNGKLLTNTTYGTEKKVCMYNIQDIINAPTDGFPEPQELNITQKMKSKFVIAKDGNLYTTAYEEEQTKLVKINPDFTTESIVLPFDLLSSSWVDLYFNGITASNTENAIFIPSKNGAIYKYIIGDESSLNNVFIEPVADSPKLYGNGIQENPVTSELYTIHKDQIIIRNTDGSVKNTIESKDSTPKAIIFLNK